jgi:hypothetical protein
MRYKTLETVVLNRDLPDHGLRKGDLGSVVQLYEPDALEVEFVRASGRTEAMVTLKGGRRAAGSRHRPHRGQALRSLRLNANDHSSPIRSHPWRRNQAKLATATRAIEPSTTG